MYVGHAVNKPCGRARQSRRDAMTTAVANRAGTPVVEVTTLADGLVVRLAGALGAAEARALREVLLRPRPAACRDVLVDAGDVDAIEREPLTVIAAASRLATATGRRLSFTRLSDAVSCAAESFGVRAGLTLLGPPGSRTA
jgi:anti-anti-sigma regulatory factor